ncbi:MAG: formylglycine-generating enzyme family protein, partial [Cytophagales bacterium]|nr:formylglycine-generating enzyme family protein [Cytophagales bacterium]
FAGWSADDLGKIAAQLNRFCAGSFEQNYVAYRQSEDVSGFVFLQKAYALQPDNPLTYADFILYYEQTGNEAEKTRFCRKWLDSKDLSVGLLSYCYNLLMSVEANGILLNTGESTTLPLWVLQNATQMRPDVAVLDLVLMQDVDYRKHILSKHRLQYDETAFSAKFAENATERLSEQLSKRNPERRLYFSVNMPWEMLAPLQNRLFVVGLASQFSDQRMDNVTKVMDNLENRFLLDYLRADFGGENRQSTWRVLNANYIAPMLLLHTHYRHTNNPEKAHRWADLALRIAQDRGKAEEVSNYLKNTEKTQTNNQITKVAEPQKTRVVAKIKVEELEKSFKQIFGNLYAQQTEVTNREYQRFLDYLQETKQTKDYEANKPDLSGYDGIAATMMQNYHRPVEDIQDYKPSQWKMLKERTYIEYPVINISHEAALKYCTWLTEQYNQNPNRKYGKVRFRLPTLNEWRIAAVGAKQLNATEPLFENLKLTYKPSKEKTIKEIAVATVKYPWWRVAPQLPHNEHGCYLGNFRVDSSSCMVFGDGFGFTSPIGSYFANDIGLYDVVGNVAEMISEKGKACGGSWDHLPQEATITSVTDYDKSEARVGFRVFMEIVEERKPEP